MPNEQIYPQYFAQPMQQGEDKTKEIYMDLVSNREVPKRSRIWAYKQNDEEVAIRSTMIDGMPGMPLETGMPNPDVFQQGEDVVFALLLIQEGVRVQQADYDITVFLKSSAHSTTLLATYTIGSGLAEMNDTAGMYTLTIPSELTSTLLAGAYYLAVQIKEKVSVSRFERRFIALQHNFCIEYGLFSPNIVNARQQQVEMEAKNTPTEPIAVATGGYPNVGRT